jgi:hypothetical protein
LRTGFTTGAALEAASALAGGGTGSTGGGAAEGAADAAGAWLRGPSTGAGFVSAAAGTEDDGGFVATTGGDCEAESRHAATPAMVTAASAPTAMSATFFRLPEAMSGLARDFETEIEESCDEVLSIRDTALAELTSGSIELDERT